MHNEKLQGINNTAILLLKIIYNIQLGEFIERLIKTSS